MKNLFKDGRFVYFQSSHLTVMVELPIGKSWLTGKHHGFSIRVYVA